MTCARSNFFRFPRLGAIVLCSACLAFVGACDKSSDHAVAAPTPPAFERTQHTASGEAFLDVVTTLDRTDLTVADRVHLTITCTARAAAAIKLPDPFPPSEGLTVASTSRQERALGADRRQLILSVVLEPFLAGDQKTIAPITIAATDGAAPLSIKTDPIPLTVTAVADAKADASTPLEAVKAPVDYVTPVALNRTRLWIILGCAFVGVLAALGFAAFTSARRARREADPVFRVRRELESVRATLDRSGTAAEAAVAAEQLFRAFSSYLNGAFGLPADTHPLRELTSAIEHCGPFHPSDRADLLTLLADMEAARFAPDAVSVSIVRSLLDRVAAFVDRSAPSGVRR